MSIVLLRLSDIAEYLLILIMLLLDLNDQIDYFLSILLRKHILHKNFHAFLDESLVLLFQELDWNEYFLQILNINELVLIVFRLDHLSNLFDIIEWLLYPFIGRVIAIGWDIQ